MNDFGAPTKYQDDYPEKALAYFTRQAAEPVLVNGVPFVNEKTGQVQLKTSEFPTIEGLGKHLGIWYDTIDDWRKTYSDFDRAIKEGIKRGKDQLIQGGMLGRYHPNFTMFVAKNCTDMVDKRETSVSGNLTLDQILGEIDGKS